MRALIANDDGQLRRIEQTIANIEARPQAERDRMSLLLAALQTERTHILRYSRNLRQQHRPIVRRRRAPAQQPTQVAV